MGGRRCYACMNVLTAGPVCAHCGYDNRRQNASHQLPAGTVLKEQYLVGKVLGQGGFGITYMGWDLYLDIPVAIKEYFPKGMVMRDCSVTYSVADCSDIDGVQFRNNKERFLREAKMLARFSYVPEIVQIRNFFLANNTGYIVMEYVNGITLKEYVDRKGGRLSPQETFRILGSIADALAKVHKAGLVHRDISPDNIMMLPHGGCKLLDFGAVRDLGTSAADKSTQAILRPGYAPIEQYLKRGELGPWTDVHALCGTMYYCMTGEVPMDSPDRMLSGEDIDWRGKIPGLSERQYAALEHGTALRVENRTPDLEQFKRELFDISEAAAVPQQSAEPSSGPTVHAIASPKQQPDVRAEAAASREKISPVKEKKHSEVPKPRPERRRKEKQPKKPVVGILAFIMIALIAGGIFAANRLSSGNQPLSESVPTETEALLIQGSCGAMLQWTLDPDTGLLTVSGKGDMHAYSQNNPAPWMPYSAQIRSVKLDSGITGVGSYAFFNCGNITSVELSDTVSGIDEYAFHGCGIREIRFPDTLRSIEERAFSGNPLVDVVIPDGTEYLGPGCFDRCEQLKTVTVGPDTRLNYDIWYGPMFGDGSGSVTIRGYSCTMVEDYAGLFSYHFESLGEDPWDAAGVERDRLDWCFDADTGFLKIGATMGTMVEDYTSTNPSDRTVQSWMYGIPSWMEFRDQIVTVSLGEIYGVGAHAFAHCANLTDINWGDYCGHVAAGAFMDTNLDHVVLDEVPYMDSATDVAFIGEYAFADCANLKLIRLNRMQMFNGVGQFFGCDAAEEFWHAPQRAVSDSGLWPFYSEDVQNCPSQLTVYSTLNNNYQRAALESGADFCVGYGGMAADNSGRCGKNVWWMKSGDTLLLYGTGATWVYYLEGRFDRADILKENGGAGASQEMDQPGFFQYASDIRRLIVLPGVERLTFSLFSGMHALEEVDLGTVESIGDHVFQGCDSLKEILIPESVRSLGDYGFAGCSELEQISFLGGIRSLGKGCFDNCLSLQDIWFNSKNIIQLSGNPFNSDGGKISESLTLHLHSLHSNLQSLAETLGIEFDYQVF